MEDPDQPPSIDSAAVSGVEVRVEGEEDLGVEGIRAALSLFGQSILGWLGHSSDELSVLLCDDEAIRDLNYRYRGMDTPTDVLSFEQSGPLLGDVVISLETASRQAHASGISQVDELRDLLLHGILHLVGRDHGEGAIADEPMLQEQKRLLELFEKNSLIGGAFS